MKIRAIVTGATGMVGEGVLHECLNHPDVEQVLIINRKPSGISHPKLKEIVHANFHDLAAVKEQLKGYNACYFCLGVSSVGLSDEDYKRMTYDLTMHFAETVSAVNTDMTFIYVSGSGTDSTEQGRLAWARVKGKTENDLMKLPFKKVYAFRPGYMQPTPGLKNTLGAYKYISWLFPVLKAVAPNYATTLGEVGIAMINATSKGYEKQVVEVKDILVLAHA